MAYASGEYTATYNAKALGNTQDGWRMEVTGGRKGVTVDKYGDMEVDGVYRGVNVFFECILKDWAQYDTSAGPPAVQSGMNDLWWPYSTTFGRVGVVGRLEVQSSMTAALVLTALAGTPAAVATIGPLSITASKAILDADFARTVNFNSEDRSIPVRIRSYPFTVTVDTVDHIHVFSFT